MKKETDFNSPEFLWAVLESLLELEKTDDAARLLELHPEMLEFKESCTNESQEETEASWQRFLTRLEEKNEHREM